ncbi:hypothetical protein GU243_14605 [Pseudarthrobacter psychrotolerans]|uniref:Uncharacterized protein n=1 Tax=Pseudarthrobacter psychrotolerans TaxID=2697569 RepID=A0A6P1NN90_9MICC|nr:hypothetical protein [Pseudarthrobacter psychrotolerans]QHK20748.1 hypothetical protein GU243_14605 [Pseudarthrobacter psychrotolerans]
MSADRTLPLNADGGLGLRGRLVTGRTRDVLVTTEERELVQAYRAGTPQTQERNDRADSSV